MGKEGNDMAWNGVWNIIAITIAIEICNFRKGKDGGRLSPIVHLKPFLFLFFLILLSYEQILKSTISFFFFLQGIA